MRLPCRSAGLIAAVGVSLLLCGCLKKEKVEKAVEDAVGATAIKQGEAMKQALHQADSLRKAREKEIQGIK
jgi:hypothetical protein